MNGPGTDSLTIRHTPGTVPGGARPGWGLPYQRLPGTRTDLTPESLLKQEIQTGRQAIQDKYALQWKNANRGRRFVGTGKTSRILRDIDTRAKQEMLQFNQRAEQQMIQLQNINRLAQQGAITNPEEIKARIAFGPDVARSMYPPPEKGRTPAAVMGELNRYKEIVQSNLDRYRSVRIPEFWKGEAKEKRKTQFLDYSLPAKKEGKVGAWRDITVEDIQNQSFWQQELKEIEEEEMRIAGIPGIKHRIVQPGTVGGTFSDKVAESYKKPVRQRPRPIRQRPGSVPTPKTEAEYNALPPGMRYRHPSGDIRTKK